MENFEGAFFDTHAHLSYLDERGIDAQKTVTELFAGGFQGIIDIGTRAGDLAGRVKSFSRYEKVRFAAGIWPWKAAISQKLKEIALLEQDLRQFPQDCVVAIGECGFDRRENPEAGSGEREMLEMQLDLAKKHSLPVIIHSREAAQDTREALSAHPDVRGIIHCYSYGPPEAKPFLDMGYYISFAGNLTFKNAANLRETLKTIPRDRLLLETDCPFLAPVPFRGKPAHPGMIAETYKCAAACLNIPLEELTQITARNARTVFRL